MATYPNEKKDRNKALLVETLNGVSMLDRIINYRISSVRIGIILRRETTKIFKLLESGKSIIEIALDYSVIYKDKDYSLTPEKIQELVDKEKAKQSSV